MKQLYYSLITLVRGKGGNVVRLISLTLGLLVGILLFSQIVYELKFDTFYRDHERLVMFGSHGVDAEGNKSSQWEYDTWRPAAAALMESMPDCFESTTPVFFWTQPEYYIDDKRLADMKTVFADTLYFQTMGIDLLSGDPKLLAQAGNAFLSQSKARELFGTEDPVGKHFSMDKRYELTVRGVYTDLPGNISFPSNVILSLPTIEQDYGEGTWHTNDIYMIYCRLRPGVDIETVNRRIDEAIGHYTKVSRPDDLEGIECQVIPVTDFYFTSSDNVRRLIILAVLGFSIFFVSGMNYVLAAIASIGRRAKMIGVHKCCGADTGQVLAMSLYETALLMLVACVACVGLIFLFADPIENLLGLYSIDELFTLQNLWVPALTVVLLFVVAGVVPGLMFARIPVTQVFRRYTDDKRSWKRGLLFVQFAGVAFILGMLVTTAYQYHDLMTRPMGFRSEHLAVGQVTAGIGSCTEEAVRQAENIAEALARQPYVESVARSELSMVTHYSTMPERIEGSDKRRSIHHQYYAKGFPEVVGLELVQGRWPQQPGEALVSEKVVKELNWGDQVIGRELLRASRCEKDAGRARVTGVIRDVRNMGFQRGQTLVTFILGPGTCPTYHVRLKEPVRENLLRLNDFAKQTYGQMGLRFLSYDEVRSQVNESVYRFRNTVYVTSACILLIVLMGLIGYVADETGRRSKEIAIRKVNGAEAYDVLRLLSVGILKVAAGAVLIGVAFSLWVSDIWMEQFSDCTLPSPLWFVLLFLALLLLIVVVVVLKAWRIANENPVLSIKSE